MRLHVRLPMGNMILYDANVPIDDYTTVTKLIQLRDFFKGKIWDFDARRRVRRIFETGSRHCGSTTPRTAAL